MLGNTFVTLHSLHSPLWIFKSLSMQTYPTVTFLLSTSQWAERAPPCWLGLIDIVTPHMIPFWNPWDHRRYLGIVCTIFGHPQNDQEGQKYLIKSFGGFWVYWCRLWRYSPIYDTFLEPLGQWKYLWIVYRIFCHH